MTQNPTPLSHLGVGIDTARYGHHVSFLDQNKRSAAPAFHFTENAQGYAKLRNVLDRLVQKHPGAHLHIHVDAAGQYAENLLQWLHRQDLPTIISVGQPARNKAYRKVHYDKRKADPVESLACARFAVVEQPEATPYQSPQFSSLRDCIAQMEASAKARTRLINQLHNLLARSFPELAALVKDLSARSVLKMLEKYPTAERIAAARLSSLSNIPHLKPERAEQIHAAAKSSTASNCNPLAEQLIKQKVQAILSEFATHAELEKLSQSALAALPPGGHRRVRTIPGIGPQTDAALVAKIVSIDRFRSGSALVGYFGIFPEEIDVSGTDKAGNPKKGTEIKMSRKGNDLVRRLLYTAAQSAVKCNPPVHALFARLRAAGKDYNTAIGHCMAKLLRQVFAVWKKDCDFDPEFECGQSEQPALADPATSVEQDQKKEKTAAGHRKADKPQQQVVTATESRIASPPATRPAIDFAELRRRLKIEQVVRLLGWPDVGTSQSRGAKRGWCPVHGRGDLVNDRSLAVNFSKNVYCCHRCGSQGNALDLWAAANDLPIFEAAWDLIERLRIDPPLLQNKEELSAAN